ncbi:hypothetical protein KEM56_006841 [Ascosphaera pollenicola]|nr:hypothetical protein KEM56_006841 [Ascosphaera pollenicola]
MLFRSAILAIPRASGRNLNIRRFSIPTRKNDSSVTIRQWNQNRCFSATKVAPLVQTPSKEKPIDTLEKPAVLPPRRIPEFSLAGKVILVTGGARGLGLTVAEAILEAGAKVYALDRLPEPAPDFYRLQKRATQELGTDIHYVQVDVRDAENLHEIVGGIADKEGRMDGLLAAAGVQQETSALDYTAKDSNTMLEINITGVLMAAQAVAKQMIRLGNGGSIAMIASMSGSIANKGLISPVYNASKAGVLQLSRNLASEWGQYGIRVNTISPGYIVTSMVEKLFDEFPERKVEWPKQNMLGRLSSPEEYRGATVFLLSDASSFMTGGDVRMDGGHSSW